MNKICFYNQSRVSVTSAERVTPGKVYTSERLNMEKEAYYFPHFSNARHDRKIQRLRKELGIEGYGIFFMLLETLRDQIDLKYPMSDIDLLADEFGTSEQKIRTVIANYQLFELDESELFFSPRMLVYLQPYFSMKEQRKIAGRASAEARRNKHLELPFNGRSTVDEQKKVKESKENESKTLSDLEIAIEEFCKMRNKIKKPLTEHGLSLIRKKLNELSTSEVTQVKILERSIENSWQGVFPLTANEEEKKETINQQVTQEQLDIMDEIFGRKK